MLKIYRKYAAYIAIAVVVFFVGTMFTGAVLFGQFDPGDMGPQRSVDKTNTMAYNQSISVSYSVFNEMFQRLASQVPESVLKFNPEMIEQLSFSAYQRAVEYQQLATFAEDNKIKVSNNDYKTQLPSYLNGFGVESESELKKALSDRGVSYKQFKKLAKENIRVSKAYQAIISQVAVTDLDIEWSKQAIGLTQFSIPVEVTGNVSLQDAQDKAKGLADEIYIKLQSNVAVESLVKEYSQLMQRSLDSVKWGQLDLKSESLVFDLSKGEISEPIIVANRVVIYRLDTKTSEESKLTDEEKNSLKDTLLANKQQRAIQSALINYGTWQSLTVVDKRLDPVVSMRLGKVGDALSAYKVLVSQSPSNPVPYYLLGSFEFQVGLTTQALETWEKAAILAEVSPEIKLPILYLKLGSLYKQLNQSSKMNQSYNKAIKIVDEDLALAEHTASYFKSINESSRAKKVERRINELKEEKADQERRLKEANQEASPTFLNDELAPESLKLN